VSITVSAVKARQNLGELLNLVSIKHEEVIIERAGKKIARLTAIDEGTVNEPVAEAYSGNKNPTKKSTGKKHDFSEFFGTWDDEEYKQVMESVKSGRKIDSELWK
jgi:antitoxin (DNA-binding transcriptional repressor) of toxin-antitoxin stability system